MLIVQTKNKKSEDEISRTDTQSLRLFQKFMMGFFGLFFGVGLYIYFDIKSSNDKDFTEFLLLFVYVSGGYTACLLVSILCRQGWGIPFMLFGLVVGFFFDRPTLGMPIEYQMRQTLYCIGFYALCGLAVGILFDFLGRPRKVKKSDAKVDQIER